MLSVYVLTDVRKELSGGYSQETLKKRKRKKISFWKDERFQGMKPHNLMYPVLNDSQSRLNGLPFT